MKFLNLYAALVVVGMGSSAAASASSSAGDSLRREANNEALKVISSTSTGGSANNNNNRKLNTYDGILWDDLPEEAKAAAQTLGYTATTWNIDGQCGSCHKKWAECLSSEEKDAASSLGYTQGNWKGGDGSAAAAATEQSGGGGLCFSKFSTVQIKDKGTVSMDQVQVGDEVLAAHGKYQTVYALAHYNPTQTAEFVQISTDQPYHDKHQPLEMTAGHIVFKAGVQHPVPASSIRVGDLLLTDLFNHTLQVTEINTVQRKGVFAPHTLDGTVVVNGVLSSCYAAFQSNANGHFELDKSHPVMSQQDFIHLILAPWRLLCVNVSPSLCQVYNEDGLPYYVSLGIHFNQWASEQNTMVKYTVYAIVAFLAGVFRMLEMALGGPSWAAPLSIASLVSLGWMVVKKKNASFKKTHTPSRDGFKEE